MFARILIPIDGSPQSSNALQLGSGLATQCGATLVLVYVISRATTPAGLREAAEREGFMSELSADFDRMDIVPVAGMASAVPLLVIPDQTLDKFAKLMLEKASTTASDAGTKMVETKTLNGEAAEAILQCAEDEGADLIVTGSRGVGDLHSLFLGSVSHKLAQDSRCPCLVVK